MPGKIRVLLIEDDLEHVDLILHAFQKVSQDMFDVHHVGRFRDAIQAVKSSSFNVVLLDLDLPDSSGLNGVERLMSQIPQIPVIVLTGVDNEQEVTRGIELGAQEFLQKSEVSPKLLVTKIRHAIKRVQFTTRLIGQGGDALRAKRMDDLAESVRAASSKIDASAKSLGESGLSEDQLTIVEDIKRSSLESLHAIERLLPSPIDFAETDPDSKQG